MKQRLWKWQMPCSSPHPSVSRLISTPVHGCRDAPLLWICHHSGSPHTAFQTCEGFPSWSVSLPPPTELLLGDLTFERENQGTKEQQTRAAFISITAFRKVKATFLKFISSRERLRIMFAFVCPRLFAVKKGLLCFSLWLLVMEMQLQTNTVLFWLLNDSPLLQNCSSL